MQKEEIILSKYGRGKVLGEAIHVIPQLANRQPYTIKCTSLTGVLLRISKFEFEKKVLINEKVKQVFKENAVDGIIGNNLKLKNRFQMHKHILETSKTDLENFIVDEYEIDNEP